MAPFAASLIAPMASSLIQPVDFSLVNAISGKGAMRAGKKQEGGLFPVLELPLVIKVLRSWVTWNQRGYNNMVHRIKIYSSAPPFKQYQDY